MLHHHDFNSFFLWKIHKNIITNTISVKIITIGFVFFTILCSPSVLCGCLFVSHYVRKSSVQFVEMAAHTVFPSLLKEFADNEALSVWQWHQKLSYDLIILYITLFHQPRNIEFGNSNTKLLTVFLKLRKLTRKGREQDVSLIFVPHS